MKKNTKKIIATILITVLLASTFLNMSFAENTPVPTNTETTTATELDVNEMQPIFNKNSQSSRVIINVTKKVLEILQVIGIAVGLVMLVIIGIKYITSAGDKDKQPEIWNVVKNYVFGAFLIFGATGILTIIQQVVLQFDTVV